MINAVTEFFGEMLGGPDAPGSMDFLPGAFGDVPKPTLTGVVAQLVELFADGVTLEKGVLPPEAAREIVAITELQNPEDVSEVLVESGFLKKRKGVITPTKAGEKYLAGGSRSDFFTDHSRRLFEALVGRDDWEATIEWFIGEGGATPPEAMDFLIPWLYAFNVVEETSPGHSSLSDEGRTMMHKHREIYQDAKRFRNG